MLELGITAVTHDGDADGDERELFSLAVRGEGGRVLTSISIRPNELDALACALAVAKDYIVRRTYKPRGARHRPPPKAA